MARGEATDRRTGQGTSTTHVAGVLQGYGAEVAWADLAEAAYAVQSGAVWVATNIDSTLPTARWHGTRERHAGGRRPAGDGG